jgi:hypothetical protein
MSASMDSFDELWSRYEEKFGEPPPWDGFDMPGIARQIQAALESGEPIPDPDANLKEGEYR